MTEIIKVFNHKIDVTNKNITMNFLLHLEIEKYT